MRFKTRANKIKTSFLKFLWSKCVQIVHFKYVQTSENELLSNRLLFMDSLLNHEKLMCDMPVNKGRFYNQIIIGENYTYPAVAAIQQINGHESAKSLTYIEDVLTRFAKKNSSLNSFSDFIGAPDLAGELGACPPWIGILPWVRLDNFKMREAKKNFSTGIENEKRGLFLDAKNGGAQFPLSSERRAHFEAFLLFSLNTSILKKGFDMKKNLKEPAGCIVLVSSNEEWVWMCNVGIHRVTVLAAHGLSHIPLLIKNVVFRDTVRDWYMVRKGLCSEEDALRIFDSIVKGRTL